MAKTSSTSSTSAASPSLAAWQARATHEITLPSGQRVRIRIPGIATLLEHGDLPDDLVELALLELTTDGGATAALAADLAAASENGAREKALERIAHYGAFQKALVCKALCAVQTAGGAFEDVTLTPDTLDALGLPEDDLAMVAELVQRLRAHDARGVRIGVEPIDRWAAFREAHSCSDSNCEGCAKLVDALSTADVGSV